jgi:glycosyltransferase involved in cell wall biosynthesis
MTADQHALRSPAGRRLKVVHIIRSIRRAGGGAQTSVFHLLSRLDRTIFEPVVVCLEQYEPPPPQFQEAGIRMVGLMMPHRWSPLALLRLSRLLRRERTDIAHTHLRRAGVTGRIAARLAGVPIILAHVRNLAVRNPLGSRLLDKALARITARVIAVSPAVADQKRQAGIPAGKLTVIINGVDREQFRPLPAARCREPLGLPPDDFVVGFSGRLEPAKHVDVLIRAAALARPKVPELRVAVAGEGPERPRLEALARDLGIADRVNFLGHCAAMHQVYPAFDVLCLPSETEGCSRALLEGAACAIPLVSTPIAFAPDMVGASEEAGLLVPIGKAQALADALARLARDRELRGRLGKAIRERSADWSIEEHVRKVTDLYLELWKEREAGRA